MAYELAENLKSILVAIQAAKTRPTAAEIANKVGQAVNTVSARLTALNREGAVTREKANGTLCLYVHARTEAQPV